MEDFKQNRSSTKIKLITSAYRALEKYGAGHEDEFDSACGEFLAKAAEDREAEQWGNAKLIYKAMQEAGAGDGDELSELIKETDYEQAEAAFAKADYDEAATNRRRRLLPKRITILPRQHTKGSGIIKMLQKRQMRAFISKQSEKRRTEVIVPQSEVSRVSSAIKMRMRGYWRRRKLIARRLRKRGSSRGSPCLLKELFLPKDQRRRRTPEKTLRRQRMTGRMTFPGSAPMQETAKRGERPASLTAETGMKRKKRMMACKGLPKVRPAGWRGVFVIGIRDHI